MAPSLRRKAAAARRVLTAQRHLGRLSRDEISALRMLASWHAEEHVRPLRFPHISDDASISPTVSFRFAERVAIGRKTNVGPFAAIWGGWSEAWIRIGDGVMIGQCCTLVAGNHRLEGRGWIRDTGFVEADVEIGDGAMVAAGSAVIGCRVGTGAVVGAGAIVTRDIPDYAIAVGVPARVIGERPPVADEPAPAA